MKKKLVVIINDRLSDLITKGEITPRYYNPGEVFDEVHLIATNDDRPDLAILKKTAGRAELFFYNFPIPKSYILIMDFFPEWVERKILLLLNDINIRKIDPLLVRCYGSGTNSLLAYCIYQKWKYSFVVSLHTHPDAFVCGRYEWPLRKMYSFCLKRMDKRILSKAAMILPVYSSILDYLESINLRERSRVLYNVLDAVNIRLKSDYTLSFPIKILSVGRIVQGKFPLQLVKAISEIPSAELTIIGDGSWWKKLKNLVKKLNLEGRVFLIPSLPNNQLVSQLYQYDLFAVHSDYPEMNKSTMEAMLAGLPIILNKRRRAAVKELNDATIRLVENTKEGYKGAILALLQDKNAREEYARAIHSYAVKTFLPEKCEIDYKEVYESQQ
ncbi:MAG: glycosyltransferase [Oligoflexia bacterium]|nr:glycosyltransferase [Oligoflexia bacterium]